MKRYIFILQQCSSLWLQLRLGQLPSMTANAQQTVSLSSTIPGRWIVNVSLQTSSLNTKTVCLKVIQTCFDWHFPSSHMLFMSMSNWFWFSDIKFWSSVYYFCLSSITNSELICTQCDETAITAVSKKICVVISIHIPLYYQFLSESLQEIVFIITKHQQATNNSHYECKCQAGYRQLDYRSCTLCGEHTYKPTIGNTVGFEGYQKHSSYWAWCFSSFRDV